MVQVIEQLTDRDYLKAEYWDNDKSTYVIAQELKTTPTRVLNALKRLDIPRKSKSQAQKVALSSGRHPHPTEGTQHSAEVKRKISETRTNNWHNMSQEERDEYSRLFSDAAKKQWEDMTEVERARRRKAATDGIREASKHGSKLEHYIATVLRGEGFSVRTRVKSIIPNERLEVDMYLPELRTVIEIDGPSHFLPVWGEENLRRNILADSNKNGLLLGVGLAVIRVKNANMQLSQYAMRHTGEDLVKVLSTIQKRFPKISERLIHIEVSK